MILSNQRKRLCDSVHWTGCSLESIKIPNSGLPPLKPTEKHDVFFDCERDPNKVPNPYPSEYVDDCSSGYVRMPCSPKSCGSRWSLIQKALNEPIRSVQDLKDSILSYNPHLKSSLDLKVFEHMCTKNLFPDGDTSVLFEETLPGLCKLALDLPKCVTKPIPLMKSKCDYSITLSQHQIACLLANAFFCTFPDRDGPRKNTEYSSYPYINFTTLLSGSSGRFAVKVEKVRCIMHYFHRVLNKCPTGAVTFTRRCLASRAPNWEDSSQTFDRLKVHLNATESLNSAGPNTMHVDFADPYIGGIILEKGCFQEEVMFISRPELIISCLFVEKLGDDESFIIEGPEQYSKTTGYAKQFKWSSDFDESKSGMIRDEWGRWNFAITAIDARRYRSYARQFVTEEMLRELNKAYCGFTDNLAPYYTLPAVVATGNWGCGAFRGNLELKFILQMMACVEAGKSMAYYTFGKETFFKRAFDIYNLLANKKVSISQIWKILNTSHELGFQSNQSVFDFVTSQLNTV